MAITSITLTDFRSYREQSFKLDPRVTLILGPNGSGKTNILEALYVAATTKSFRARDEALVREEQPLFRIDIITDDGEYLFGYQKEPTAKKVSFNGVKKTLRGHVGSLPVVLFEPGDLQLLAGPPRGRRAYMDTILCQTDAEYLQALNEYKRGLRQRNALLHDRNFIPDDLLFAWNLRLASPAMLLRAKRAQFVSYLQEKVPELYAAIAGKAYDISLAYIPSPGAAIADEEHYLAHLESVAGRDVAAGFTTTGPHRDDLEVYFDGQPIDARASRGEHRSVVLALKLAELAYQSEFARSTPLFMLDDVFSELDHDRRGFLLEAIGDFQTIVTTTDADAVKGKNYYTIDLGGDHE